MGKLWTRHYDPIDNAKSRVFWRKHTRYEKATFSFISFHRSFELSKIRGLPLVCSFALIDYGAARFSIFNHDVNDIATSGLSLNVVHRKLPSQKSLQFLFSFWTEM